VAGNQAPEAHTVDDAFGLFEYPDSHGGTPSDDDAFGEPAGDLILRLPIVNIVL
jgi:hypothetical protein